jgi:hypothetical protein
MKFLVTRELGKLATWLRILGFDAQYSLEDKPGALIIQALKDDRLILTRNQRLPKERGIRIILVRSGTVKEQLCQTFDELKIKPDESRIFSRCVLCNKELAKADKDKIKDSVPEFVFASHDEFFACPQCGRAYWAGTHWGNVSEAIKEIGRICNS